MRVNVTVRDLNAEGALIDAVERRIRFALGRFSNRVRQVDVTLTDVNGPRGGADQQCRLRATLPTSPPIVVETHSTDALAAVGDAAERAARRISESLNRARDLRRGSGTLRARTA